MARDWEAIRSLWDSYVLPPLVLSSEDCLAERVEQAIEQFARGGHRA